MAGAAATVVLVGVEARALGPIRVGLALSLLAIVALPTAATVRLTRRAEVPGWLHTMCFVGALAAAFLSAVVVPPGSSAPPPLWPAAVAGAALLGLERRPVYGAAAGTAAGVVLLWSAPEVTPFQAALAVASVIAGALAGALPRSVSAGSPSAGSSGRGPSTPEREGRLSSRSRLGVA